MRPIGFVICCRVGLEQIIYGKIYPYYKIHGPYADGDYQILINNVVETSRYWNMYLERKLQNGHWFDFFSPPEFPKDISSWTEDDWFQFDLKYGS